MNFENMQNWIIILLVLDLGIILLCVILLKRSSDESRPDVDAVSHLDNILKPLLEDAQKIADQFDEQLREKQLIIRKLNENLDSRIISLNLLLNRAEISLSSNKYIDPSLAQGYQRHVYDLQEEIIALAEQNFDSEAIAKQMEISIGEVNLVLDLKRKFTEMEEMTSDAKASPAITPSLSQKIPTSPDALNAEEVLALAAKGLDSEAIAKRMSVAVGEVDLILNLKKKFTKMEQIASYSSEYTKKDKKTFNENNTPEPYHYEVRESSPTESLDAEAIMELATQGMNSETIAKRMGVSRGEVDMLLELKKKFIKMKQE
ncbi:hypothetical protein GMMP15_140020 [Candidatus Magnetomoraceae bacterium gMMP-15]